MGTVLHIDRARADAVPAVTYAPPSNCRGSACPAFALCQGRCESKPDSEKAARSH